METRFLLEVLGGFVIEVMRGQRGKNPMERLSEVLPNDARDIVFGLAFEEWQGARLLNLAMLVTPRYHKMLLAALKRRLKDCETKPADWMEEDALIGLLEHLRDTKQGLKTEIEGILAEHAKAGTC